MIKIVLASEQHKQRAIAAIKQQPLEPRMVVEVKPYKSSRSLDQNALYWKWLTVIKNYLHEHYGQVFTEDDLHDYYRKKFLPVTVKQIGKEEITRLTSTTKLNVAEMSEYMNKIDQFCIDKLNLFLPTPDTPEDI